MGRIDEALAAIHQIEDPTIRALELSGLLSTLFKIKGVILIVTGRLAFDSYTNSASDQPELELGVFSGTLAPRTILEVMRGQVYARGLGSHWRVADLPVQFLGTVDIHFRDLCRDFMTDHGVVKLLPAEEITVERILASVYPAEDVEAQTQARLLLINGLSNAFQMDWNILHQLCHRPEYRVGEELAKMRTAAKQDVDAIGAEPDPVGLAPVDPSVAPASGHDVTHLPTPLEPPAVMPETAPAPEPSAAQVAATQAARRRAEEFSAIYPELS